MPSKSGSMGHQVAPAALRLSPEARSDATDEERFQARAEAILAVYRDERGQYDH